MSPENTDRRVKGFLIETDQLLVLVEPFLDIPSGAKVVGVEYKAEYLGFLVVYEHPDLPLKESGKQISITPIPNIYKKKEK